MAAMISGLVACEPGKNMVRTDPGLYPTFLRSITDYVNRCDPDSPTKITVDAPRGTTVSIDGRQPRGGRFTTRIQQQVNERFTIVVRGGGMRTRHHVRCLPDDFPQWSAVREGRTEAQFYATTIIEGFQPNYPVIFDRNGVPVWWTDRSPTFLLTPMPNDRLATLNLGGGMVEHELDGSVARVLDTRGAPSDFHDVIRKPNGNYVMATFDERPCSLRAWGEGSGRCIFHNFQELTPRNDVVWQWRPETDIPIRETTRQWRGERSPSGVADPWHYNSLEWTGDGFIISFRHNDAVYKIDYESKDVVWKLGGNRTPERLRVIGDPVFDEGGRISGQHDARLRRGNLLSLFDNGSQTNRAPRSVTYRIDEQAMTATRVNRVADAIVGKSFCCGSTRVIGDGHRVTGWGGSPWFTENKADGEQIFRLDATFVYRAIPILPGQLTRRQLRAGMDAQYDDGAIVPAARAPAPSPTPDAGELELRLGLPDGVDLGT